MEISQNHGKNKQMKKEKGSYKACNKKYVIYSSEIGTLVKHLWLTS